MFCNLSITDVQLIFYEKFLENFAELFSH